jgi:hypothetical protein
MAVLQTEGQQRRHILKFPLKPTEKKIIKYTDIWSKIGFFIYLHKNDIFSDMYKKFVTMKVEK